MSKVTNVRSKIYNFFSSGFKKMMSPNVGNSFVTERIKSRSIDLFSIVIDVFYILFTSITIIFYCFYDLFKLTKDTRNVLNRAAKNNFRLGLEALKKNNLIDARIRFLLANMFYSKSPTIKYHIAYVYYLQRNFTKSLKYLKQSISLDSRHEKSIVLLQNIDVVLKTDK